MSLLAPAVRWVKLEHDGRDEHLPPRAMLNLVRMGRPVASVVIFMNAEPFIDENDAYHISEMEENDLWRVDRIEEHDYMSALDRPGKLIIARYRDAREAA